MSEIPTLTAAGGDAPRLCDGRTETAARMDTGAMGTQEG